MMAELTRNPPAPQARVKSEEAGEPQGPLRRCIVTRAVLPKERLVRFVLSPDDVVVPDIDGRLPGRGIWLQARRDVVETACKAGSFAKAARKAVRVPDGLADQVEALLERRCLDALGLARRAGQAAAGYEKVRSWLREGRAALLAEATDGAESGRVRPMGLAAGLPIVELLTAEALGRALGRDHAVHVALGRGALARRFLSEALRLAGFRAGGRVVMPRADEARPE